MKNKSNKEIVLKVLEEFSMEDKGNHYRFMGGMIFSDISLEYQSPRLENFKEWLINGNVKLDDIVIQKLNKKQKEEEKYENIVFFKKFFKISLFFTCLFVIVILLNKWK